MLLFYYSKHEKPRISYEDYDCCSIVTIIPMFGYVYIGGMARQNTHTCVIKLDFFDIFSVSLCYIYELIAAGPRSKNGPDPSINSTNDKEGEEDLDLHARFVLYLVIIFKQTSRSSLRWQILMLHKVG